MICGVFGIEFLSFTLRQVMRQSSCVEGRVWVPPQTRLSRTRCRNVSSASFGMRVGHFRCPRNKRKSPARSITWRWARRRHHGDRQEGKEPSLMGARTVNYLLYGGTLACYHLKVENLGLSPEGSWYEAARIHHA